MSMPNKKLLAAGLAAGSLLLWGCQERGPGTGQTADYQFQQQDEEGVSAGTEGSVPAQPEATPQQPGTGGSGETGLNTDQPVSGTGPASVAQPNPDGYGDTAGNADTTMDTSAPTGQGSGEVAPGGLGGTGSNTNNEAAPGTGGAGMEGTGEEERVTDPRMEPGAEYEPGVGAPEPEASTGGAGEGYDSADGVTGTTGEETDTATGTTGTQSESGSQEQP